MQKFNRQYYSEYEFTNRYNQFVSNLDTIAELQDYYGDSASFGINKFADFNGMEWYFTMLGYYD